MTDTHGQKDSISGTDQVAEVNVEQPITPLVYPAKPGKKSRRFKATDDIDIEYAEEFEDAFYGEGM